MRLIVKSKAVKLCNLRPGKLFMTPDMECLALKTEYRGNDGQIDAYIVGSGEYFWGGTSDPKVQQNLDVLEVKLAKKSKAKKILKEYLISRLKKLYKEHDEYLSQGGNGEGQEPQMDELKKLAAYFNIKIKKENYEL